MNRWTTTEKQYSKKQGWGIFAIDGNQDCLAIQRDDEENIFESDLDATNFVIEKAKEGDVVCKIAAKMILGLE